MYLKAMMYSSDTFIQQQMGGIEYHDLEANEQTTLVHHGDTFISHMIASVLLVPIAKEVGQSLPGEHVNLLIFMTGLLCSVGMDMPVSGFPNQTVYVHHTTIAS
jgi:hypothetical protein